VLIHVYSYRVNDQVRTGVPRLTAIPNVSGSNLGGTPTVNILFDKTFTQHATVSFLFTT